MASRPRQLCSLFCLHSCTKSTLRRNSRSWEPRGHNLPFTRLVGSKAGQDRTRSPRPRALNTPQLLPPALTSLFCYQTLLLTPFDKEMKSTALKTTLSFLLWEPALSIQTSMASQFETPPALLLIRMPSAEQGHRNAQREP